jgi:hypothetical protein
VKFTLRFSPSSNGPVYTAALFNLNEIKLEMNNKEQLEKLMMFENFQILCKNFTWVCIYVCVNMYKHTYFKDL